MQDENIELQEQPAQRRVLLPGLRQARGVFLKSPREDEKVPYSQSETLLLPSHSILFSTCCHSSRVDYWIIIVFWNWPNRGVSVHLDNTPTPGGYVLTILRLRAHTIRCDVAGLSTACKTECTLSRLHSIFRLSHALTVTYFFRVIFYSVGHLFCRECFVSLFSTSLPFARVLFRLLSSALFYTTTLPTL